MSRGPYDDPSGEMPYDPGRRYYGIESGPEQFPDESAARETRREIEQSPYWPTKGEPARAPGWRYWLTVGICTAIIIVALSWPR